MYTQKERPGRRPGVSLFSALVLTLALSLANLPAVSNAAGQGRPPEGRGNFNAGPATPASERSAEESAVAAYGQLPLSFEANLGQTDPSVHFISRGNGYSLFLTSTESVLALGTNAAARTGQANSSAVLRIKMAGANPDARASGLDELPGRSNYYTGNQPEKWRTGVPTFARVRYAEVYPGIDLVYYGNQRQLEYDYIVAPGADPSSIRLAFEGTTKVTINGRGDLLLETDGGQVVQHAPVIYQEVGGARKEVAGSYVLAGKNEVRFDVGEYDTAEPLVIDPLLTYSTYLGGNGKDQSYAVAVDAAGNAYVTGFTFSSNFPKAVFPPYIYYEVFVSKMNAAGSALLYSTYVGGGSEEEGWAIAVDTSGNAYVTGHTYSSDFPTVNAYQNLRDYGRDAFVTKLNASGVVSYSTFLGGEGSDTGYGIAVDSSRNIYVAGTTYSGDFPTHNAYQAAKKGSAEAFLTKLNAAGSALLYSTYLGGGGVYDYEEGYALAIDAAGHAYVTGSTSSTSLPTTANAFRRQLNSPDEEDVYVAKFLTTGSGASSLVYSSYVGGRYDERGYGIAVDSLGVAYVTGTTESDNFPTKNAYQSIFGGYWDAFLFKLNTKPASCTENATDNCTQSLMYSTYVGGTSEDGGRAIAADPQGNAYLTGYAASRNFPVRNALQGTKSDYSYDAFLVKLNPKAAGSASLVYSTYLKGTNDDDVGRGIALDRALNIYVAGYTYSADFIKKNPYQSIKGTSYDAFVLKVSDQPALTALTVTPSIVLGSTSATGKVTLSAPAPATGVKVTLTDTLAAATVPVSVTVPAGATFKTFTITTTLVSALQSGNVSASFNGTTKTAPFKVRPIGVASLTVAPNPVVGPNKPTATVTLERPAAPGNITVTLSSSNPSVASPAVTSIVIPAGTTSKTFTVNTADVLAPGSATLKATAGGVYKTVVLKVN